MYKNNIHPEVKNCSVSIQAPFRPDVSAEPSDFQPESVKHPYSGTLNQLVYVMFPDDLHKSFPADLNIREQLSAAKQAVRTKTGIN